MASSWLVLCYWRFGEPLPPTWRQSSSIVMFTGLPLYVTRTGSLQDTRMRYELHASVLRTTFKQVSSDCREEEKSWQHYVTCCCTPFSPSGARARRQPGPPHSWGFQITHIDKLQSPWILWTRDRPVAKTSTWQHTTLKTGIHASGEIRTRNPTKGVAPDTDLRPLDLYCSLNDWHFPFGSLCRIFLNRNTTEYYAFNSVNTDMD
jgi:hypothetical protein